MKTYRCPLVLHEICSWYRWSLVIEDNQKNRTEIRRHVADGTKMYTSYTFVIHTWLVVASFASPKWYFNVLNFGLQDRNEGYPGWLIPGNPEFPCLLTVDHLYCWCYLSHHTAHLEAVALSESQVANVTLVWFLARVDSQVSLEFVCVWAGVRTVRTLVWPLTYTPDKQTDRHTDVTNSPITYHVLITHNNCNNHTTHTNIGFAAMLQVIPTAIFIMRWWLIHNWLTELRFYVPPDTKYFISETFFQLISWLSTGKLKQTQQKQTCIHNKIYYDIE